MRPDTAERERAREAQCPMRRHGQCLDLNLALGHRHGLALSQCDRCWQLGPHSEEARRFRAGLADRVRAALRRQVGFRRWTWAMAASFLRSVLSRGVLVRRRVGPDTYRLRVLSCYGDPDHGIQACRHLMVHPDWGAWCGACGCGSREIARLGPASRAEALAAREQGGYTKLMYPYLECPMGRPGFERRRTT